MGSQIDCGALLPSFIVRRARQTWRATTRHTRAPTLPRHLPRGRPVSRLVRTPRRPRPRTCLRRAGRSSRALRLWRLHVVRVRSPVPDGQLLKMRSGSATRGTGERGATGSCRAHRGGAAMPRRERPLHDDGDGPSVEFATELRQLERTAGNPPYRSPADQAHCSISPLSSAASGQRLPTLSVTPAYVRACAGDTEEWRERRAGPGRASGCGGCRPRPVGTGTRRQVNTVAFGPDGRNDWPPEEPTSPYGWDSSRAGRPSGTRRLTTHTDAVDAVAFAPDGRRLTSGGTDGTVRRWEPAVSGAPREGGCAQGTHRQRPVAGLPPRGPHAGQRQRGAEHPPLGPARAAYRPTCGD